MQDNNEEIIKMITELKSQVNEKFDLLQDSIREIKYKTSDLSSKFLLYKSQLSVDFQRLSHHIDRKLDLNDRVAEIECNLEIDKLKTTLKA
jgi:hypothetical protein